MTLSAVKIPTVEQLRKVAAELGMTFSDQDLAEHLAALGPGIAAYNIVDKMSDDKPAVTYPRAPGRRRSPGRTSRRRAIRHGHRHAAWRRECGTRRIGR